MIRRIAAVVATGVLALGVGGSALANKGGTAQHDMMKQKLGLVNVYLQSAIDNTKFLTSMSTEMATGNKDAINEAERNLDTSIDKALTHIRAVKAQKQAKAADKMGADKQNVKGGEPKMDENKDQAGGAGAAGNHADKMARLDAMEKHLKDAKTAMKTLRGAKPENMSTAIEGVSSSLMAARNEFQDLAKMANLTLIQDMDINQTAPVRGKDDQNKMQSPTPSPSPSPDHGVSPTPTPSPSDQGQQNQSPTSPTSPSPSPSPRPY